MRSCLTCGYSFPLSDFYRGCRSCKSCTSARMVMQKRARQAEQAAALLKGHEKFEPIAQRFYLNKQQEPMYGDQDSQSL